MIVNFWIITDNSLPLPGSLVGIDQQTQTELEKPAIPSLSAIFSHSTRTLRSLYVRGEYHQHED